MNRQRGVILFQPGELLHLAKLRELEDELADPAAWSSPGRVERGTKRHEEAKAAIEELYAEWEAAQAEAEGAPT